MSLTAEQRRDAGRLQRNGRTLREIAREIGASFEDVCLWLYGGVGDWARPIGARGEHEDAGSGSDHGDPAGGGGAAGSREESIAPHPPASRVPPPHASGWRAPERNAGGEGEPADTAEDRHDSEVEAAADAAADAAAVEENIIPAGRGRTARDPTFLHQNEQVLTRLPKFYWTGSANEIIALKQRQPKWRTLTSQLRSLA